MAVLVEAKAAQSKAQPSQGSIRADSSLNFAVLASQTEGYLPTDLVDLVDRAIYAAAVRKGTRAISQSSTSHTPTSSVNGHVDSDNATKALILTLPDFQTAQENFTPVSLRSLSLSPG